MSIKNQVLSALTHGRQFTSKQMAGIFRTTPATITARISELRSEGYPIYSTETKNGKTAYFLGAPSRKMVKLAYLVNGSEAFQHAHR